MRILLVSDFYPPTAGGLEAHVARLRAALDRRGHDVLVVTAGNPDSGDASQGVRRAVLALESLPGAYQSTERPFTPPWADGGLGAAVDAAIAELRPEVLHAHGWSAFSALQAGRRAEIPVVVTLHDYGLLCPLKTLERGGGHCGGASGLRCLHCPAASQSLPKRVALAGALAGGRRRLSADALIAVSSFVADRHRRSGVRPSPVVIPNFLEDPVQTRPPAPAIGGPILFVGSEAPNKGMGVVIDAYRRLPSGPGLILVGGARREDRADIVHLGRLQGEQLWEQYRRARLVVVPSQWQEPCPTVALEAMRFGRPVVGCAVGGMTDIVADGRSGVLVPPGDVDALAAALQGLLDDPGRAVAMGAEGWRRLEQFSESSVIPRIEAVYRQVRRRAGAVVGAGR